MIFNDKNDCIESIIKMLERTSAWRRAISQKFPSDARNMRAADTLDTLAVQAAGMNDEQWQALSQHYLSADFKFFAKALAEQLSSSAGIAA